MSKGVKFEKKFNLLIEENDGKSKVSNIAKEKNTSHVMNSPNASNVKNNQNESDAILIERYNNIINSCYTTFLFIRQKMSKKIVDKMSISPFLLLFCAEIIRIGDDSRDAYYIKNNMIYFHILINRIIENNDFEYISILFYISAMLKYKDLFILLSNIILESEDIIKSKKIIHLDKSMFYSLFEAPNNQSGIENPKEKRYKDVIYFKEKGKGKGKENEKFKPIIAEYAKLEEDNITYFFDKMKKSGRVDFEERM